MGAAEEQDLEAEAELGLELGLELGPEVGQGPAVDREAELEWADQAWADQAWGQVEALALETVWRELQELGEGLELEREPAEG